jgi:hypothetical protein
MKQQTTTTYENEKRLKIKCSVHPNFSKIPPQEHGINELKFKIKIIYVKQSLSPLINKGLYSTTRRDKASTSPNSQKITRNEIET